MKKLIGIAGSAALLASTLLLLAFSSGPSWTEAQLAELQDLRLVAGPAAPDPSNRWAASEEAAALGHELFFDERLSSNGEVSCASCHLPEQGFQDGTPFAHGVGTTARRTMPIAGMDASKWFFWDGRKDSLWSQALGPLESAVEHGGDRVQYVRLLAEAYREKYESIFGPLPDLSGLPEHAGPNGTPEVRAAWEALDEKKRDEVNRVFANLGKAIAAYERKLQPGPSRFDRYVDAVIAHDEETARKELTPEEEAGLRLFVGKASCTQCHNGPQLTNHDFHNTGVPAVAGMPADLGRAEGTVDVLDDEFNCLGKYSDAKPEQCRELRFLKPDHHALRQYKAPSLRNVAERAPYMHAGQLPTLEAVIDHYDRAPAPPMGEGELKPLGLSGTEKKQLASFLRTLSSPLATDPRWLRPPGPVPQVQLAEKVGEADVTVDGSVITNGTVAGLELRLHELERWPRLFGDVRAMKRGKGGVWAIDSKVFGHPHRFRATRQDGALLLELAEEGHGKATIAYRLEQLDARRVKVSMSSYMTRPEQLTLQQMVHVLRAKATADLQDLARNGGAR